MKPTIITMNDSRRGCPDGFTVVAYQQGQNYTVDEDIDRDTANRFLGLGAATVLQSPTMDEETADILSTIKQRRA